MEIPNNHVHQLFLWGSVDFHCPTLSDSSLPLRFPTPYPLDEPVRLISIAAGARHVVYITDDNAVYVFGNNSHGQLGLQIPYTYTPVRLALDLPAKPVKVFCGDYHNVLLLDDGELYAFGSNTLGQCGCGSQGPQPILAPVKVAIPSKVVQVSLGSEISFAVTAEGALFSWGSIQDGALGHPGSSGFIGKSKKIEYSNVLHPRRVSAVGHVVDVAAGQKHVILLDQDGNVFGCGFGAFGRLGMGKTDNKSRSSPEKIPFANLGEKIVKVGAGAEHSFAITTSGGVFFWGREGYHTDGQMVPLRVQALCGMNILSALGGRGYSLLRSDKGEVLTWGQNDKCSSLGLWGKQPKKRTEPKYMELLDPFDVVMIAAGAFHSVAVAAVTPEVTLSAVPIPTGPEPRSGPGVNLGRPYEECLAEFKEWLEKPVPEVSEKPTCGREKKAKVVKKRQPLKKKPETGSRRGRGKK